MSGIQELLLGNFSTGGYQIERSLRFNSADSAYLNRTPASASNRKTWTWSGWIKRSKISDSNIQTLLGTASNVDLIGFNADDTFRVWFNTNNNNTYTTQVFRDVSAWYHFVVAVDTTQATDSNRLKIYVNGSQITALTASYPTQNYDTGVNNTVVHRIGVMPSGDYNYFSGYMTEVNFIDGSALTPSSFGQTNSATGVWEPIAYTGTYGTNGFYLKFADNSGTTSTTLGKDSSGNGNNWTPNNFSVTAGAGNDSLVDSPTQYGTDTGAGGEVRGNYCTMNPLNRAANGTMSNGNLEVSDTGSAAADTSTGTISMKSGKYYFEFTRTSANNGSYYGIIREDIFISGQAVGMSAGNYGYNVATDGTRTSNGSSTSSWITAFSANDVCMVAYDAGTGKVWFGRNGTWGGSGDPAAGTNAAATVDSFSTYGYLPWLRVIGDAGTETSVANFGQRPFAYTAPSGYKALCTTNLPTPTIGATATTRADDYFNTVLYTGTGSSLGVTGVGFQPDFVWIKERSGAADHGLYDAVRGVQKQIESNTTTDETTETTGLTAFGTDGFTVGALAQLNTNTDTYVAWNWKETATAGFDIVTYTGNGTARTISHNLGVAPNMIIVKARTTASTDQGWPVYHSANTSAPETDYLLLNDTAATADLDTVWNDTAPTSSVFSVGTNALVNANNDTYVAYLFAPVAGYSAFGSYTGNGSATDGAFVYTGFRPAFVMVKRTNDTGAWRIFDIARSPINVIARYLYANYNFGEDTGDVLDFVSNGFKYRNASTDNNASGSTYIYMAFAEFPFKYTLAR